MSTGMALSNMYRMVKPYEVVLLKHKYTPPVDLPGIPCADDLIVSHCVFAMDRVRRFNPVYNAVLLTVCRG